MRQSPERKEEESVTPDILGKALQDYMEGIGEGQTFVLRDDGFRSPERIGRYFQEYSEWPEVERRLLDNVVGGRVLEIGCNVGKHLKYLKGRGLEVVGIDISPGAVAIAREGGIDCRLMDARKMDFEKGGFNTVLILYYGLGLAGTIEEEIKMLSELHRITAPDGRVICSSIDASRTDDPRHLAYQEFNRRKGKPWGNITQVTLRIEHCEEIGGWYDLLFINPDGLRQLVKDTGWRIEQAIPQTKEAQRWFYVLYSR